MQARVQYVRIHTAFGMAEGMYFSILIDYVIYA
jgi:hypothetical protein